MKNPYITKTVNNTVVLYIPFDWIDTINSTQWAMIMVTMESWCVWKTNIGDTHTGWEYSDGITPEMVQRAFKKCSGITLNII